MLTMVLIVDVLAFLPLMLLKCISYFGWVFYDYTPVDSSNISVNAGFEHCHGCITSEN